MKSIAIATIAFAFMMSGAAAHAGGWNGKSGGLVNVSPSVQVGSVGVANGALSGNSALNGNAILSGNAVSGILNGNTVGVLSGNGLGIGILSGNNAYKLHKK